MKREKNLLKQIFVLIIIGLFIFACKESDIIDPTDSAPEIPPVSTFQMNFDAFSSSTILNKATGIDSGSTKSNWIWASFNGIVWQTLITAGMVIPVTAFVESFNHDPQQQEDGRWLWSYEFTPFGGIKHTASLYGSIDNSEVTWEMYISKEGVYEDFLWYFGESNLFATEGTWTLNIEPNNPTPWIYIEWHRNPEDSTADIKYTNIVPGADENGGYIHYGITNDLDYDAFYDIFEKGKNNLISIKWNRQTHEGRVTDPKHYGDSEWHCWNANFEDIDCH